jgi:DMSO reductase anchor subunit
LPRNLLPADHYAVSPQHAHTPLVVMLVLTQLSVGTFLIGRILEFLGGTELFAAIQPLQAGISLSLAVIAMAASVLHLGRPLYAFRAIIGLRTSWLSREILAFGLFAFLAACSAVMNGILSGIVVVIGLLAVFCSVMVYHDTRRPFWHVGWSGTKFFLTTVLLGLSTTLLTGLIASAISLSLTVNQFMRMAGRNLLFWLLLTTLLKLSFEALIFVNLKRRHHTPLRRTADLMVGPLHLVTAARFTVGLIGGGAIPAIFFAFDRTETGLTIFAILAMFVLTLVGELLERRLFFTAVVAPKMPGGLEA